MKLPLVELFGLAGVKALLLHIYTVVKSHPSFLSLFYMYSPIRDNVKYSSIQAHEICSDRITDLERRAKLLGTYLNFHSVLTDSSAVNPDLSSLWWLIKTLNYHTSLSYTSFPGLYILNKCIPFQKVAEPRRIPT